MEHTRGEIYGVIDRCADSDTIFICDREGYVVYCHAPVSNFFQSEEVLGKHILSVFPTLSREIDPTMRVLDSGEGLVDQVVETATYRGDRVTALTSVLPIRVAEGLVGAVVSTKFYLAGRIWEGDGGEGTLTLEDLLGSSPALGALREGITALAHTPGPVLIHGEPGAGKAVAARALHSESPQAGKPFLEQNCARFPAPVLARILFGSEPGAHVGAVRRRGLLERADGGTLYLSQLDKLAPQLQRALVHVLSSGLSRRVGGTQDLPIRVRLVGSLNRPPRESLLEKKLSEELFDLLRPSRLAMPPLREHQDDILPLARRFIGQFNQESGRNIESLSPLAEGLLLTYAWPGNVRELHSTLEGAFHNASGNCLLVEDLRAILAPEEVAEGFRAPAGRLKSGFSLTAELERYERSLIRQGLAQTATVAEAARLLGLSRQLLQYKMQKFDL